MFQLQKIKRTYRVVLTMLLSSVFVFSLITPTEARPLEPIEELYHMFPSQITAEGWRNPFTIVHRDVGEVGLRQEFSNNNSATLILRAAPESPPPSLPLDTSDGQVVPSTTNEGPEVTEFENVDTERATSDDGIPSVPESIEVIPLSENPSTEPVVDTINLPPLEEPVSSQTDAEVVDEAAPPESLIFNFFKRATDRFLFTQADVTEAIESETPTIPPTESEAPVVDTTVPESTPEVQMADSVDDNVVDTNEQEATPEVVAEEIETPVPELESEVEVPVSEDAEPTQEVDFEQSADQSTEIVAVPETQSNSITLSGFGLPDLAPGQFIDTIQLRVSLGGSMNVEDVAVLPTLTARYTIGSFAGTAGSILLDEEVSNAMNGGYYLLAFPSVSDPAVLDDLEITLSYDGDMRLVEALHIDAVWLEVSTKTFTKEAIEQRQQELRFAHLQAPEISELISPTVNFGRDDDIRFNLRYQSQRNFVVRTARQLFGRNLAEVESARFVHRDLGDVGVVPVVTVTTDGLVTVQMSDADKERLRPGQYELELTINEGGKLFSDSFNFQWGMLSLNPRQSEYGVGEVATIDLGSLSPNGNTVCNANLELFVVAPDDSVAKVPVIQSGLCNGNNVIDVPDYSAQYTTTVPGEYQMYLERLDDMGEVIAYTSDTFLVSDTQRISIARSGPSRIYPVAPYTMELTVETKGTAFSGTLVEQVPSSFEILDTNADIQLRDGVYELTWPVSLSASSSEVFFYEFDAPNISPYLFTLGPARLESAQALRSRMDTPSASTEPTSESEAPIVEGTEASPDEISPNSDTEVSNNENTTIEAAESVETSEEVIETNEPGQLESTEEEPITQLADVRPFVSEIASTNVVFAEHRQWQIASDAVGNMILYWTDGAAIPVDWTCLSCGAGTFFERFAMGSSTYNVTGGALTHTHTAAVTSVAQTLSGGLVENRSGSVIAANDHAHTVTPTIGTASNLPAYRTLRVIQYTGGAGEPPTIPAGAVALFDAAVPTGWTRYNVHDGFYIYGADTIGATGGANTHTHTLSGTLSTPTGATLGRRGGGTQVDVAGVNHTHSFSTNSPAASNEPPYIEVILGEIDADGPPPVGMISMWTEDVPAGWIDVSTDEAAPFSGRFVKASTTYGATGGSATHTQPDAIGITAAIATTDTQSGQSASPGFGSPITHDHAVDITGFSEVNHLPPYLTVVYGKRIGLDATYSQTNYRWYQNTNAETPTTPWNGVLEENEAITLLTNPVESGQVVRLRMNAEIANATSSLGDQVKLQYAAASVCSAASGWTDVGAAGSGTIWRGFDNAAVADGGTLGSTLLASSTDPFTYEENGTSAGTPTEVAAGDFGEWDFVVQNNGAAAGTTYCFRLVFDDDSLFFAYPVYPQLITNATPAGYQLIKRFDNENSSSTLPTFDFFAVDPESDKIDYQVQIASDFSFSSIVVDRNSVSNATQFENQVLTSEKNPFTSGQTVRFTNTTTLTNGETYWWRVRGRDPDGSNEWGDWSIQNSFTVTTSLTASGWLQREDEQFERGILDGVEVYGSNQVRLITGSTTGTITSPTIDFQAGEDGTAWDQLRFTDDTTNGSISYQVEYRNGAGEWNLIPNTDLPSNSTGFSVSPVNLLGLDVSTYRFIRIVATLTDSGGTPFLQDWAVDWGFRVETPDIASPFPNEKVGTTTPTFTFTTTDPQNDGLTYQIEWSTDPTFSTGVTTRTSDTDAGFVNLDDGADTDPFTSGDTILFTVQPADILTDGTTYWWRVRAKDTTGDNEYSFWTPSRSFTVDGTVVTSTWFQTTQAQFESNILSGTTGVSGGVTVSTVASEALIVYGEGTVTTPRYRIWNGSSWSTEGNLVDINSTTRWVVTEAATTREEYVAATIGSNGHVIAQVFSLGEWGDVQTMTTTVGSTATRGFDVAYETVSGQAMVVYCDGDANPSYRTWNGTSWSAETTITSALTSDCRWVELASNPTSDEITMVIRGVDAAPYQALVWDGTTWGNSSTFGSARVATYSGIALEYEESGDQAVAVAPSPGGGPNRMVFNTWNGTTWSGETTQTIGGRLYWGQLAQNRGTDELVLCYTGDGNDVRAIRWTGTAWAGDTQFIATANAVTDPAFSCVFENGGARENYIVGAYSGTTATNYRTWNTTAWSAQAQINSIIQTATMQLIRTDNNNILGTFFDYTNNTLRFSTWNGTTWSGTQSLEDSVSVTSSPYGYPYWMTPRNPGSAGTVVVAPAIEFSDGLGPYWNEFSWNETLPGTSEITYQLQYFNGSTWQFIPNSALAVNETGFTTSPVDLSGLNISTYGTIRPFASLQCDGASNCPTLNDWTVTWAEGITVSGTLQEYDQATNVSGGTVAVAVNGVLQIGKTGTVSAGAWSIDNVTVFPGDVVTVFLSGAADVNEAVGVARYNGFGDMTGFELYERHLSIGSASATSTPITNANIGLYSVTNTEDVFVSVSGGTLQACADSSCDDVRLFVKAGNTYQPGGRIVTHDIDVRGTFIAGAFTHDIGGSWVSTGTTTMTGSTIVMTATTSTETINTAGAVTPAFANLRFGTTTGSATWELQSPLETTGNLTVLRGTLNRQTEEIFVRGTLSTEVDGLWSGIGTTTFSGGGTSNWRDLNATLQNVGHVVIDGTAKTVVLTGPVLAESITIGSDDVFDVSASNHQVTVNGSWRNQNVFVPRQGTVRFVSTNPNRTITPGVSTFYNLTFDGTGGSWSFTAPNVTITNDVTITDGTVTLPTATTSVGGSWDATGGIFAHNNGEVRFTANNARTITVDGGEFTNSFYDLTFTGAGSWTMLDSATTTRNVRISAGAVTFPGATLAIGGSLTTPGGSFVANDGTVRFFSSASEVLQVGSSAFANVAFDGVGDWTFTDPSVTATGDVSVLAGTLTLPSSTLTIGGSYLNADTVTAGTSTVVFNANTGGHTVDAGDSTLYNVRFNNETGGWTVVASATSTNAFELLAANTWTLQSGATVSVGTLFTNTVGGASTTWTGSTLSLEGGQYDVNSASDAGDIYDTLRVNGAEISLWNSIATSYDVVSGSIYSQDHNAVDGDLYIFGDYQKSGGAEYWSYSTDFDGTDLTGGSERTVRVRLADTTTVTLTDSVFDLTAVSTATTTVANQGGGTYTVSVSGGTTTAQYFAFADLGTTGLSLLDGVVVQNFDDGSFTAAVSSGAALTVASSTIDANPAKQIFRTEFATTSAISAVNVRQTGGAPTSFWWFRNGFGNLYGEDFDDDTGDPGSVRFDDSSLVLTISGTVYTDRGVTPLTGGTCDGTTPVVRVVVDGGTSYTGSCSNIDGSYSIGGVVVVGDPTLTVYLDGASGGERAVAVTRTPTGDMTDLDLYTNRVIVRNEDTSPLAITNLAAYDQVDDADIPFTAATGTPNTLTTESGTELYVWEGAAFAPDGVVTLGANAQVNDYDGTLFLATSSVFEATGTSTVTIGGRLVQGSGASFVPASTTVLMNATTTGKSITATDSLAFHNLTFNGVGGAWNIGASLSLTGDMVVATGTVTGTGDITLVAGELTGNGTLSLGGGTTTIVQSNQLGGSTPWTFFNLSLGNGLVVGTTTPLFTATTTILGTLTIANAHFLDAGATIWDLAGGGTVLTGAGTLVPDTSTFRFSGPDAFVPSRTYYNLSLNAGAGTPTYTATGLGILVQNDLTVGGEADSLFTLATNNALIEVVGDVLVASNGTLTASPSAALSVGGNWTNAGTFTANSGTVTFDGDGVSVISAGNSPFANIVVDATGSVTVSSNATSTGNWTLTAHDTFTVDSGQVLAVGGQFFNGVGGANTVWTGSTLALFGGDNYTLNASTTNDVYGTLAVRDTTHVRLWNSDATVYDIAPGASVYSQDHAGVNGELYVYGAYTNSSYTDHWSYVTDFDGTDLTGSERPVTVRFASGASATLNTGGALNVLGVAAASTTITNQGSGTYSLTIAGGATNWSYYTLRNMDADGLSFTGSPAVTTLSYGDIELTATNDAAMTVAGSVITANPAKTFTNNRFALGAAASGVNVRVTGSSVSSWRFTNHVGNLAGEGFDDDPDGDPGYVAWDDSAALITISGRVYADEGSTVSSVCDGSTNVVTVRVAGLTSYQSNCNASTGLYSVSNVAYSPGDSLVAYIDGQPERAATVSVAPISNISNFDIYENRVIVRHEGVDPITNTDIAVWDSSDDADIPFTVTGGALTLPADRKLIVWNDKSFAPGGNVTISGGGAGDPFDGTLELFSGATFIAGTGLTHTIGGSFVLASTASFTPNTSTVVLTTAGSGRSITVQETPFYNLTLNGSGSWSVTDPSLTVQNNLTITAGDITLPAATTTIGSSFENTGGSFIASTGTLAFTSTSTGNTVTFGGSDAHNVLFAGTGGAWAFGDTNATATASFVVASGTATLPSGRLAVGSDFITTGSVVANNGTIDLTSTSTAVLQTSGSDLGSVTFSGGGAYTMVDPSVTLLGSLTVTDGEVTLPNQSATSTLSVGGSLTATGGTFVAATGTVLFNGTTGSHTINPGVSAFHNLQIGAPSASYTLTASATTTENFTLAAAAGFTVNPGVVVTVQGAFNNFVGGAATTWDGSSLVLNGSLGYTINTKSSGGDEYDELVIGANSAIRVWNSRATTTTVASNSSLYSQDHAAVDGDVNIYGSFVIATSSEFWSYATDFDGVSLTGSERAVTVRHAAGATTTLQSGSLAMVGTAGNETTITNQGSGVYGLSVTGGSFTAQHYNVRNIGSEGLSLSGTPIITSLSNGDFELVVDGGSLITLTAAALNANASLVSTDNRFATTTAITGTNVNLIGTTPSAWTFVGHTGNLSGEAYDNDGITECGSVRWDDSACLLIQQTQYRWRNDDGGIGVPDDEWFDTDWGARQRVRVTNSDATTYTNAAVKLTVSHDTLMRSDFADLRFTTADGVTLTDHFIETFTTSDEAVVWVLVPTLAANQVTTLFMYFDNAVAADTSDAATVFAFAETFEGGSLPGAYSGDTSLFSVGTAFNYERTYGLDNASNETARATDGIFRTDISLVQGQTLRYFQYVDTTDGSGDEVCTLFAVQSPGTANDNYGVCLEQFGTDRVSLVRDVIDTDASGTMLASTTITYVTGWYEIEIDWRTDDEIVVRVYQNGVLEATVSANDGTYTSGGVGFTYWFNHGGWDIFTARPYVETAPTALFGATQAPGGATWAAAQNTPVSSFIPGDRARIRFAIENTGLAVTDQEFRLEYAPRGSAPSCEAVDPVEYVTVPPQSSCGTSPLCMQTSTNVTNGGVTTDLLTNTKGLFVGGEVRTDPSNTTSPLDINQNEYTEIEYVVTPTENVVDQTLCLRVTDAGIDLDTYLRVATLQLRFDPVVTGVVINEGLNISLLPGTTTPVAVTGTVVDLNGYTDIVAATSTLYRSGVGPACSPDNNNCYISSVPASSCSFTDCAGNTCTVSCVADVFFHADPTDFGPFEGEEWLAFIEVSDASGGFDFSSASGTELFILPALSVDGVINYGTLEVNQDTGAFNPSTDIINIGNVPFDIEIDVSNLSDGGSSVIPAEQQKVATSTFTYSACVSCVSQVTPDPIELLVDVPKPTVDDPPVAAPVYWGISVPLGINSTPHQGVNVISPVSRY